MKDSHQEAVHAAIQAKYGGGGNRTRETFPPRGYVYFIQAGGEGGPVKIGWALEPTGRMSGFQCGNHLELGFIAFGPGTQAEERDLHKKFARSQIRGEWFAPTTGVLKAAEKYARRMDALRKRWKEEAASV